MTNTLNGRSRTVGTPSAATPAPTVTDEQLGQQLTELPVLDLAGKDLNDYATYVRKIPGGGTLDFRLPLGSLIATSAHSVVQNKVQLRTLTPVAANDRCDCLGGVVPFDNQGGMYVTVQSTAADNDGDRIRPNDFRGFVWFKWMI